MSNSGGRGGRGGKRRKILIPKGGRRNRNNLVHDRPTLNSLERFMIKRGKITKGHTQENIPYILGKKSKRRQRYFQDDARATLGQIERAMRGEKAQTSYRSYTLSYF
jgi:hypothetical protein